MTNVQTTVEKQLNLLIVEDRINDAELEIRELRHAGYEVNAIIVDSRTDYLAHLHDPLDIIIADFSLPQFDAIQALNLLQENQLDIPFIVITGTISEEIAVELMKQGATDYLLKDRLARLGQAVNHALEQARIKKERKDAQNALMESEARFRRLAENAQDIIYRFCFLPKHKFDYISPAVKEITGYCAEEFYANRRLALKVVHPEDRQIIRYLMNAKPDTTAIIPLRWIRKDGKVIWIEQRQVPIFNDSGQLMALEGIARDVTERVQNQRELEIIVSLSAALRTASDRQSLVSTILDQMTNLLHTSSAQIILADEQSGNDTLDTFPSNVQSQSGEFVPDQPRIIQETVESGQIQLTRDQNNLLHAACAPLISQEITIGVIYLTRKQAFEPFEKRIIMAIADLAANAIYRTTLHEKSVLYSRQMATISDIGRVLSEDLNLPTIYSRLDEYIYKLLPDIFTIFISIFDPSTEMMTCVYASVEHELYSVDDLPPIKLEPPGRGAQSEAIHQRKPVIINNLREKLKKVKVIVNVGSQGPISRSGLYVPMIAQGQVIGVTQVQSESLNRFTEEDAEAMSLIANTAAVAIQNARLVSALKETNQELIRAYDSTLLALSHAEGLRDRDTGVHGQQSSVLTVKLAEALGISGEELSNIQRGAILHDIGKIGIPDSILLKEGPLSPEEWKIMKTHPWKAFEMLNKIEFLQNALDIPYCHHEKWDGTGYPRGLKGEEIPLAARIFALADVWTALLSDRPYRNAWQKDRVIAYIRQETGKHFDPSVVDIFLHLVDSQSSDL